MPPAVLRSTTKTELTIHICNLYGKQTTPLAMIGSSAPAVRLPCMLCSTVMLYLYRSSLGPGPPVYLYHVCRRLTPSIEPSHLRPTLPVQPVRSLTVLLQYNIRAGMTKKGTRPTSIIVFGRAAPRRASVELLSVFFLDIRTTPPAKKR